MELKEIVSLLIIVVLLVRIIYMLSRVFKWIIELIRIQSIGQALEVAPFLWKGIDKMTLAELRASYNEKEIDYMGVFKGSLLEEKKRIFTYRVEVEFPILDNRELNIVLNKVFTDSGDINE